MLKVVLVVDTVAIIQGRSPRRQYFLLQETLGRRAFCPSPPAKNPLVLRMLERFTLPLPKTLLARELS